MLAEGGILDAPDYVGDTQGVDPRLSAARVEGTYDTMLTVLRSAEALGISLQQAADRYAEERLAGAARLRGAG